MKKSLRFTNALLWIMRFSLFQLLLLVLSVSICFANETSGQNLLNQEVSLQAHSIEVKYFLSQLEAQTQAKFVFSNNAIKKAQKISVNAKAARLELVLNNALTPLGITYEVVGNRILLKKVAQASPKVSFESPILPLPSPPRVVFTVRGTVTDDDKQPLIGATVLLVGTTKGTVTDADGRYELELQDDEKNGNLEFSFIGYEKQVLAIAARSTIDVVMVEGSTLDEVIVVSYGSQIKKELTGSVQTVNAKEFKDMPVSQLTQKLQGRLAGVQINQATGKPGQGMTVRIRGQASILANSDPLYVVDGSPIVGDISNISPDEIESISVLKDAASTALYGSRAANGVVLVTTKLPKTEKSEINLNLSRGWASVPQKGRPDMMNAQEFAQFKKESLEDLGLAVPSVFQNPAQYANQSNDWYDAMLRTAPITSVDLSMAKRNEKFSTSIMGGYLNQEGAMLNSNFNRYSLRVNTLFTPSKQVNLGFNIAPNYTISNTPSSDGAFYATNINPIAPGGLLYNATLTWPILPFQNSDGTLPLTAWIPGISAFPTPNWYKALQEIKHQTKTNRVLSNAFIEIKPFEGLRLKSTINVDLGSSNLASFTPSTASTSFAALPPANSILIQRDEKYLSWLNENTATYSKSFGNNNLEVLLGYSVQKYNFDATQLRFTNLPDDRIQTIQSAVNIDRTTSISDIQEWALLSYLARVNYNYKGKYLLQLAMRRDGSSRFGAQNRWGNFPSIGIGWVVSDEGFLQGSNTLSFLKLRASYGTVGNNNIGNYSQYALVNNTANAVFGSTVASGAFVSTLGNAGLGWETTKQLDAGLDIGLLNDRISLIYDFYTKNTTNLLYNVATAQESGFSSFNDNVGELKFWGHELSINSRNLVGKFKWTTNLNLSFNRNKVLALADGIARIYGGFGSYQTITQVGQPIGQFYGLVQLGVYKNKADFDNSPKAVQSQVGTIKYKDVNGDGVITFGGDRDDRTVIGNPFPKMLIGFVNNFSYKNLDLAIVCSGSVGNDLMVMGDQGQTNLDGVFNVLSGVKNRWRSESNPGDGVYGKTTAATFMERDWASTRFVSSGDYFTIKNITLGYTLPNQKKYFSSVRMYCSIQQALVMTKYRGSNPEASSSANGTAGSTLNLGMDWATYPVPRTISFGANLSF